MASRPTSEPRGPDFRYLIIRSYEGVRGISKTFGITGALLLLTTLQASMSSEGERLNGDVEFPHNADGCGDECLTQMIGKAFRKDQFNDTVRAGGQAYEDIAIADWARRLDRDGAPTRQ
jgi:hypothetical protein